MTTLQRQPYRLLVAVLTALAFCIAVPPNVEGGQKPKKKKAVASVQTRKKKGSAVRSATKRGGKRVTSKRGRRVRAPRIRNTAMTQLNILRERELSPGVQYYHYRSNGSVPLDVHVVTMDRTVQGNAVRIVKAENANDGLERLADMYGRYNETTSNNALCLVNANFWRAYRNTPIGPCVIDGEVVEMNPYKKWSSAFFDMKNAMIIDTFAISGTVSFDYRTFPVANVNRRMDSTGVVIYNDYGGPKIPHVSAKEVQKFFAEAVKDTMTLEGDSSDIALTQEQLRNEIAEAQREANAEYPMIKIRLRYLRSPGINVAVPCQILGIDSGTVDMPLRGCIVSFPRSQLRGAFPRTGDTLTITYQTNVHGDTRFMNAVSGTPRLVRDGLARHEAMSEGSTGRRFIQQNLARTALGVDRLGNRIIIAAVEPTRSEEHQTGATLQQMASVMKLLGAYDAMNLDGGGSSGMVVQGDHVFFDGVDPLTRRISVGLAIIKRSHVLRTIIGDRQE